VIAVKPLLPLPEGADPHVAVLGERLLQLVRRNLGEQDWEGLRVVHFRLLGCVPPGGTTISALGAPLSMTKQAAGQFVAQLEQSGHLELRVDEHDRRRRVVLLTDRGEQLLQRVNATVAALEQSWAEQVGPERYATFRAVLGELTLPVDRPRTRRPPTEGSSSRSRGDAGVGGAGAD
jgi:DNA-binding MarR family transcriptional regulator